MPESAIPSVQIPDHALLRVIGRGSYGEVWLARNIMGTQRALKIVTRAAFDSDRPWLREFEGIRRCEPVSRAHEGLVDILHMGKDDTDEFFYYVMELADDESGETDTYTPATLAARLADGKPLTVPDCLRLAESLAGALAFLHEHGLIHRDVKPSNVLYVGGVPKLGDIGLVAEAGSSRSFVGTEGYVPLDGPGTVRADLFALGKVLYEALTGMDRGKFPSLPTEWTRDPDFAQRVELNEIVLRACEGNPARGYRTAREMLAEVALVASGHSVKKLRGIERRLRKLRWGLLVTAAIAAAALVGSELRKRQTDRERLLRLRAESAENAEREARLTAMLDRVHATRHDPTIGAVTRALEVVREAARLRPTAELRDDAIFLLGRGDFVDRPDLAFTFDVPHWALDADSLLMAAMPDRKDLSSGPLEITLALAGKPDQSRVITVPNAPAHLSSLQFSRGGGRLLVTGPDGTGLVLDTTTGDVLGPRFARGSPLAFCGDKGDSVVRRAGNGGLAFASLKSGEQYTIPAPVEWPTSGESERVWPSPDGRFVLLIAQEPGSPISSTPAFSGGACLVETASGRMVWKVDGPDEQVAAWSSDGSRIALRTADSIINVDAATGKLAGRVPLRIQNRGTELVFLDSRDRIAYSTWSMNGICDLAREEVMAKAPVLGGWSYSPGRRLLLGGTGTSEWRPSPILRVLHPPVLEQYPVFCSFTPDEKGLAVGFGSGFFWWNLEDPETVPVAVTEASGATHALFSADGKAVEFQDQNGRHSMPWTGEPPAVLSPPLPERTGMRFRSDYVSISADGRTVAYGGYRHAIVRREGKMPLALSTGDSANPVGLSADGRWLALGSQHDDALRIFDLARVSTIPAHREKCGAVNGGIFSPDGKWLACSDQYDNRILATGTWNVVHLAPRRSGSIFGLPSFTRDGRMLSVREATSLCSVLEPGRWNTLFRLESPLEEIIERSGFSPGGRYFAAVGTRREIYLWDLEALEREMESLGFPRLVPAPL